MNDTLLNGKLARKNLWRYISAFAILFAIAIGLSNYFVYAEDTSETMTLNFHYQRFDNNYENWNLWLWYDDEDGVAYDFNGEDEFGKTLTVEIETLNASSQVGLIVRKGEWEEKDVQSDRFLDLTQAVDNQIDIYLIQETEKIFYRLEEIVVSPNLRTAYFAEPTEIVFTASADIDPDAEIILTEDGKPVSFSKVDYSGTKKGTITLAEDAQISKSYLLSVEGFEEANVSVARLFDSEEFEKEYFYEGHLGADYSAEETTFTVWAPTASSVNLITYEDGHSDGFKDSFKMEKIENGAWTYTLSGDMDGLYYTYEVTIGDVINTATDLYSKATGVNGMRSMVVDLEKTNPEGWENDKRYIQDAQTEAIIYELHVRDLSMDENSGIENKGKFLGFTETGTTNQHGDSTGIDSIKELGATHIHLLPSFDYRSIDETKLDENKFNWGYDPQNYNVPEGSYSTDPYNGEVRINEFKQMVQAIHNQGMGVIMDVVYNHTFETDTSAFSKTVPFYYYRTNDDGTYSDGSGCGNETASERAMMNRYIVDSVVHWANEYNIDGFRFDLMALHDIQLMEDVRAALDEIDPTIMVYGEGWMAGASPLPNSQAALKANASQMSDRIAFFSDDIRDAIKGHVFDVLGKGFISGNTETIETLKFGIVGSVEHPQIKYVLTQSGTPWANAPTQTVNYASAHDNLALWDKLVASTGLDEVADKDELLRMNKLSASIVFTSQGIPFFQAGEEFARTKFGDENSYQSSDEINKIDWNRKTEFIDLYDYYKGLITLRKAHPAFRLTTTEDVQNAIDFMDFEASSGLVGYTLTGDDAGDDWSKMVMLFNSSTQAQDVVLEDSGWVLVVNEEKAGVERLGFLKGNELTIPAQTSYVLVDSDSFGYTADEDENMYVRQNNPTPVEEEPTNVETPAGALEETNNTGNTFPIVMGVVIGIAMVAGIALGIKFKKGKNGKGN